MAREKAAMTDQPDNQDQPTFDQQRQTVQGDQYNVGRDNTINIAGHQINVNIAAGAGFLAFLVAVSIVIGVLLSGSRISSEAPASTQVTHDPARTPFEQALFDGCMLLEDGDIGGAEEQFQQARDLDTQSADLWYWYARAAMEQGNADTALQYLEVALSYNSAHAQSLMLRIRLFLLQGRSDEAEVLAEQPVEDNDDLAAWIDCLHSENLFSNLLVTPRDLEACPYSLYQCQDIGGNDHVQ
jgi:tetratricopeptide (TPR) repeat protein